MPGLDLSQVSSNWKKLQEKLQADNKRTDTAKNGLKRKLPDQQIQKSKTAHGLKKRRLSHTEPQQKKALRQRIPRMGYSESKPTTESTHNARSKLLQDHDIAASDLSAAYGTSNDASLAKPSSTSDAINSGLHPSHKAGKFISLDCEMVGTGAPPNYPDNVLARASLVNFHGQQIYDSFVQAPTGIVVRDYRTHVSGITPELMRAGYARPFAQVQREVAELLRDRILVGHAVKNDLLALVLLHPRRDLRDTSRFAKFRVDSKGRPPALRNLARSELGWEIQKGEHSSIEDARAAMALFRKEKAGFAEENRRVFGQRTTKFDGVKKKVGKVQDVEVEEDDEPAEEDEESDDMDLLDGETDDDSEAEEGTGPSRVKLAGTAGGAAKPKKKKKKKRTKRH